MRIIAEVGQNHQGSAALALDYVREFSRLGATSIKFQKRDLRSLFHKDSLSRPYENPNSFGETYGEHRKKLELDESGFKAIFEECKKEGTEFICTPFDVVSVSFLEALGCKVFKISSFDLGNLSLLYKVSLVANEIIMSTGGGTLLHVKKSYQFLLEQGFRPHAITILHCVSLYPTEAHQLGLMRMNALRAQFPDSTIGLSDHYTGIVTGSLGYALGARCFEKHVTFNRAWKGTDHAFALEPEGFRKYTRDIAIAKAALAESEYPNTAYGKEPVFDKLGKTVVSTRMIEKDSILSMEDLTGLITPYGTVSVREMHCLIGKRVNRNVGAGEPIHFSNVE